MEASPFSESHLSKAINPLHGQIECTPQKQNQRAQKLHERAPKKQRKPTIALLVGLVGKKLVYKAKR